LQYKKIFWTQKIRNPQTNYNIAKFIEKRNHLYSLKKIRGLNAEQNIYFPNIFETTAMAELIFFSKENKIHHLEASNPRLNVNEGKILEPTAVDALLCYSTQEVITSRRGRHVLYHSIKTIFDIIKYYLF
jgi:hypothetical protein